MKVNHFAFLFVLIFIISVSFASGGVFDWFGKITGRATTGDANVTITVSNTAPVVYFVSTISAQDPTINSTTAVTFTFNATDPDGIGDLTNSTARGNFSKSGETTVSNSSCTVVSAYNATAVQYHCTINMNYYGGSGSWTVNAMVNDTANAQATNSSNTFTYNALNAMAINVTSLTWGTVVVSSTNTGSNNDPVGVFNLGNYDLYTSITGKDLLGYTTPSRLIPTGYFKVDDASEGCSGTTLVNATSTNISAANPITRGNAAFGDRYFCLTQLYTNTTAQVYNTTGYGSWTITSTTP